MPQLPSESCTSLRDLNSGRSTNYSRGTDLDQIKTYLPPSWGRSSVPSLQFLPSDLTNPAMVTKSTTKMFKQVKMLLNLKI